MPKNSRCFHGSYGWLWQRAHWSWTPRNCCVTASVASSGWLRYWAKYRAGPAALSPSARSSSRAQASYGMFCSNRDRSQARNPSRRSVSKPGGLRPNRTISHSSAWCRANRGSASSLSINWSRLAGSVESRKATVSAYVGTSPTRSRLTRRRNSASEAGLAGFTFSRSQAARTRASMTRRRGSASATPAPAATPTASTESSDRSAWDASMDRLVRKAGGPGQAVGRDTESITGWIRQPHSKVLGPQSARTGGEDLDALNNYHDRG